MDIFLDSFENPKHYMSIQNDGLILGSKINDNDIIIIQKSSHPDFTINKNDYAIYITEEGSIECCKIIKVKWVGSRAKYYKDCNEKNSNFPIFEEQIIGKVIKTIDDNIFNSISVKIWEASISNLNIRALTN